ncbi:MAG: hypothetical protein GF311_28305 [Candidatus Lokiarchaeota archaeon]|nr:hypothetical protein [Candidatus Lokiarchaeota archaeon]
MEKIIPEINMNYTLRDTHRDRFTSHKEIDFHPTGYSKEYPNVPLYMRASESIAQFLSKDFGVPAKKNRKEVLFYDKDNNLVTKFESWLHFEEEIFNYPLTFDLFMSSRLGKKFISDNNIAYCIKGGDFFNLR